MLLPWWFKLGTKLLIGALPVSYERVRGAVTGYKGAMQTPGYAERTFLRHFARYEALAQDSERASFLELGPGGSLTNGILARGRGFRDATLIDVGDFAIEDPAFYEAVFAEHCPCDLGRFRAACGAGSRSSTAVAELGIHYRVDGIESLRRVPAASTSFSFSQAVFEHVRRGEVEETVRELFRVHRPGAVSSHRVDFKDHLGGGLHNLRFRGGLWESRFFPNQAFYTNRLRYRDIRDCCERAGFDVVGEDLERWDRLPLARHKLAKEFQHYSEEDLLVKAADIVLRVPVA